ncbi:PQQ-dependent sugar dehydrogenase [Nocardioides dubius]|uniref:PQQ-dependent sugar dehydrogenase n=1 Tax=Nocardioides dubius TaxID=317019 RepID=A0ABP4EKN5_9ACTN
MARRLRWSLPLLMSASLLVACSSEDEPDSTPRYTQPSDAGTEETPSTGTTSAAPDAKPRVVRTVATDLAAPWGLAFLPDGTAIVTERDTRRVLAISDGETREIAVLGSLPQTGEAGLLGVAVSPDFASDRLLFFYLTTEDDNRIVRATFDGTSLGQPEPILTGIPRGFTHDGGRLTFGPDGALYASTGETGDTALSQDRASLGGKILRIDTDGRPAAGNPDPSSPVWTLGHRNVQGLAFDADDRLWASEFGAQDFDELNLIEADANYGWPKYEGKGGSSEFTDPQVTWRTDEASPSGLAYLDGRLWMASLRGERLWSVRVEDGRASDPRSYFVGKYGRLRTVVVAPDGDLWVTTSNRDTRGTPGPKDDRILVIRP